MTVPNTATYVAVDNSAEISPSSSSVGHTEVHDLGMVGDKRLVLVLDTNPRRCRGLGRYSRRCKRQGKPVDGAYYCPTHSHQREWFDG